MVCDVQLAGVLIGRENVRKIELSRRKIFEWDCPGKCPGDVRGFSCRMSYQVSKCSGYDCATLGPNSQILS